MRPRECKDASSKVLGWWNPISLLMEWEVVPLTKMGTHDWKYVGDDFVFDHKNFEGRCPGADDTGQ